MDKADQVSKAPRSRGRWWMKVGGSSDSCAIEAPEQARNGARLAVSTEKGNIKSDW